jgi:3-dehydroshikimate dehydratase
MGETTMLTGGLLSVTFRKLTPKEIVACVQQSGLKVIEWGGDIHVPPGELKVAAEVAELTANAGLRVASYGSYYRVGSAPEGEFDRVLNSTLALGAPAIRVWAGTVGSLDADAELRKHIAADARHIAKQAEAHGLTIDLEFHSKTLTDTVGSTLQLLEEIDAPNVRSYWQPPINQSVEDRILGLKRLLPWVANIHMYHWVNGNRMSLAEGSAEWSQYLDILRQTGKQRDVMLEFVREDKLEQFQLDAVVLKEWLAE